MGLCHASLTAIFVQCVVNTQSTIVIDKKWEKSRNLALFISGFGIGTDRSAPEFTSPKLTTADFGTRSMKKGGHVTQKGTNGVGAAAAAGGACAPDTIGGRQVR
ncbi:hypothetical protein Y032_0026g1486 [Ancylostoma ceylanicum]|uniref:Uncharacterized protein n=1 Tax=Ancylostoma ceylanicum TaxID=53326 RepID=A0A016UUW1_9BILA|nr:hypothetical protein Y032_0026g1486 [Ancylostoma ceylanicum]